MDATSTFNRSLRRASWSRRTGRAFIVEVLLLFAFLIAALAVITQVFVASVSEAAQARDLERAISAASNSAERFSADPLAGDSSFSQDGLTVVCDVQPESTSTGVLYHATITVYNDNGPFYSIETARYVSEVI